MPRKRKSDEPYKRPGSKYWWIRVAGKRISSGTTDRERAAELQDKERKKVWDVERGDKKPSKPWRALAINWCREKAHKPSLYRDQAKIKWWDKYLGEIEDAGTISRDLINQIICDHRPVTPGQASKANTTANTYVNLVQWILNAACHEWDWIQKAPRLRRYPEPTTEKAWFTVENWLTLAPHLPRHLYRPALFSLATGVREARCFGLRWEWVDMTNRIYQVPGNGKKRGVVAPLNKTALSVLEECRRQQVVSREWVFLYAGERMRAHGYTTWRDAQRRAGLTYVNWHGLRHSYISWLAKAGVPHEVRQRLVGHVAKGGGEGPSMVHAGYTHFDMDDLRPYAEKLDSLLVQIQHTQGSNVHKIAS